MSIYNRDNINYSSMIDNAIRNRLHTAERDAARIEDRAKIKSQAVKDMASTFARGMDYLQYASEQNAIENKLKDLEDRRDSLIRKASNYEQERYNPTRFNYQERNNTTNEPNRSYSVSTDWMVNANPDNYYKIESNPEYNYKLTAKEQWLRDHPGMTEEDYDKFVEYYNSIYGGR